MQLSNVQPVFKLELNHKVTPKLVITAKYDGTHPCLTASAGYDKIIIHHPHSASIGSRALRSTLHAEVSELGLSQAVIALAAGPLKPDTNRDVLLIGSPLQILAYDVHENSDLFYKDSPDGVHVITVGSFAKYEGTLALVGGSSSVQGLDWRGSEVFWNVISGKVSAMLCFDFDKDGDNELILGCEDSYIRVLKNNQIILEIAETGPVTCLSAISETKFAYGLANGTIGIYEDGVRLWRVKSKQEAIALQWSGDSLASCWNNGRVDWREITSGKVLRRIQMRSNAAAMLLADYRSVGAPDLICVSDKGEVLGYTPYQENSFASNKKAPSEEDRQAITELLNRKQALMMELQHYEGNMTAGSTLASIDKAVSMPTNTKLQVIVTPIIDKGCLDVSVSTNNETLVRAALVLAEGVFETGETLACHPENSKLRPRMDIALRPPRDVPVDVHIKALIGYTESEQYHIFELNKQLPRFAMYSRILTLGASKQTNYVTFHIIERMQRICIWINQNFMQDQELGIDIEDAKDLHLSFICLRDKTRLDLDFEHDGHVKISTPNLGLAGDIVQSLAIYMNLTDLQSTSHFPEVEQNLRVEMEQVSEVGELRQRLVAETAEKAQLIAALLPAAQDAANHDLNEMLNRYRDVVMLNEEVLTGCHVRRAINDQAVTSLKNLHTILQQANRIRVGKYSKAVIAASRKAVQDDNVDALIKILQVGDL